VDWVWVLLGICALIVLHEGGHFLAAKAVGMRVERFSLFFGPMLFSRTIGETEYGIGVIPLGGYVKITGMSPEEVFEEPSVEARAYTNQPVWKRIVVIAAGPLVNLIVAFFIFFGVLWHEGGVKALPGWQISSIQAHSAASGALKAGDRLIAINGTAINPRGSQASVSKQLSTVIDASRCAGGEKVNGCVASPAVKLTVRKGGTLSSFDLQPRYDATTKSNLIGFSYGSPGKDVPISITTAAHEGVSQIWTEVSATVSRLSHIYEAKDRRQFHSIAGATNLAEQAVAQSTAEGLFVLGAISLALAIINLLPFLPLDGGHIFWALVELVRKRKVSLVTMERASYVGLGLVLCLFAIGFSNDISTWVHGGNFLNQAGGG
jgi:regulator of sigma E protease